MSLPAHDLDSDALLTTEEITLRALQNEHARLSRLAAKAKADVDEYLETGKQTAAIYKELAAIVNRNRYDRKDTKRLDELRGQQARIDRINRKDLLALMDRQHKAEWERELASEAIGGLEFRRSLQRRH